VNFGCRSTIFLFAIEIFNSSTGTVSAMSLSWLLVRESHLVQNVTCAETILILLTEQ
jgi:hypothetical protein